MTDYLISINPPRPAGMRAVGGANGEGGEMMDPQMLIDQAAVAAHAGALLVRASFSSVLGFTLHAVPMNLWYAGLLVAPVAALPRQPARPAVRRPGCCGRCR